MRAFIAFELPDGIKQQLAEVQQRLRGPAVDASWTRLEGMHLTLKFLGETAESRVPEIVQALGRAVLGITRFSLTGSGIGTFPGPKNARVVWAGLSGDIDRLLRLQTAVEEAMSNLGFQREERAFTPHLTIGRIRLIRSRSTWLSTLETVREQAVAGFEVSAISLMKSDLKPQGELYTEMGRIDLQ